MSGPLADNSPSHKPVGVSGLFVHHGRVGGAEYLLYGVTEGLLACGVPTVLYTTAGRPLDPSFVARTRPAVASGALRLAPIPHVGNRFLTETLHTSRFARRDGVDRVIFPNYFTPPFAHGHKSLTAILDLQYLHYPEYFSPQKRAWLRAAHAFTLHRADHVTVISDFVREDILTRYGARYAHRVRTVPVGVSWARFEPAIAPRSASSLGGPFILSVASQYSHKNLATLLRAFARIADQIPHDLLLVGQRLAQLVGTRSGGERDLAELATSLGIVHRVHLTGHLTDPEVGWCFRNAAAFVFPSLFEGFGMPAVEALGFGLPTITTTCGSLPEVTRGLATYVTDPRDAEELATTIRDVLDHPARHQPSDAAAASLRDYYAPARIAALYLDTFKSKPNA